MISLLNILKEIRVVRPPSTIKLGKHSINPSTSEIGMNPQYENYTWEDAINEKILSVRTLANAKKFFIDILGITPDKVKVEKNHGEIYTRPSYYIYASYKDQPIIYARRETEAVMAGQTKIYSEKVVAQLSYLMSDEGIIFDKNTNRFIVSSKQNFFRNDNIIQVPSTKENILKALKIND